MIQISENNLDEEFIINNKLKIINKNICEINKDLNKILWLIPKRIFFLILPQWAILFVFYLIINYINRYTV